MVNRKKVTKINSKFHNLAYEKRATIINASMQEFTSKGYQLASTNEIVKMAGISKGSLFNYFNNKKDLYLFLIEYGIEVSREIMTEIDFNETDLLERLKQITIVKLRVIKKYPEVFSFLQGAIAESSEEVKRDVDQITMQFAKESYQKLYENLDYSKFRDDIDIQKAIKTIYWTIEGIGNESKEKIKFNSADSFDVDAPFKEMDGYIELFQKAFYK